MVILAAIKLTVAALILGMMIPSLKDMLDNEDITGITGALALLLIIIILLSFAIIVTA